MSCNVLHASVAEKQAPGTLQIGLLLLLLLLTVPHSNRSTGEELIIMVLSVESRTCDQEVVGSSLSWARSVKALGKFLTPMCLCHQAV